MIFPLKDPNDVTYLIRASANQTGVWSSVVRGLKCPTHGEMAGFEFGGKKDEAVEGMVMTGSINTCCEEFADFALEKCKEAIDHTEIIDGGGLEN